MNIQCLICLLLAICCSCNGTHTNTKSSSSAIQKRPETLRVDINNSKSLDSLSNQQAQYLGWLQEQNIPKECLFIKDKGFDIVFRINPFYLRGDFNGDNISDVAVLIERRKDKKLGILICHGRSEDFYILGAGNSFGNGGDHFSWLNIWNAQCCKGDSIAIMYGSLFLEGEGIIVEKAEAASGLIYWKEGKYEWSQLSD